MVQPLTLSRAEQCLVCEAGVHWLLTAFSWESPSQLLLWPHLV